jgi:hypothetical protein
MCRGTWLASAIGCLLLALPCDAARAGAMTSGGLTFSDELGGFTILDVSGTGTIADPFVVVEEITGPEEAVLVIRGLSAAFGNRVGTLHLAGFALKKIVVNRTDSDWNLFEMELRERLDQHSTYGDGLSFGQASSVGRPFTSSVFTANNEIDEPYDSVAFRDGVVHQGDTVTFSLIITDTSPVSPFLLLQQPTHVVAQAPGPHAPASLAQRSDLDRAAR